MAALSEIHNIEHKYLMMLTVLGYKHDEIKKNTEKKSE